MADDIHQQALARYENTAAALKANLRAVMASWGVPIDGDATELCKDCGGLTDDPSGGPCGACREVAT